MNQELEHATSEFKCKGLTKAGRPCRAAAGEGGLCYFHANPSKAQELGRIGGRRNRHVTGTALELPRLDTAAAVRDALAQMMVELHSRRLHPRNASALAHLASTLLRAIESAELVELRERVSRLERSLEGLVPGGSG
jgi:hypothetical protein